MNLKDIPADDRRLMATWAIKTSRTEEWTGQQVIRLLPLLDDEHREKVVLHARDEIRHAELYAEFADSLIDGTAQQVDDVSIIDHRKRDRKWLSDYVETRGNFREAGFTSIFRTMESIPLAVKSYYADDGECVSRRIRFFTALFFLDLAGLMTVNVYDESPFPQLQKIALEIREDESRHVQLGRDYLLLQAGAGRQAMIRSAVDEMLPLIEKFFGGDESAVQKALQKHGIRSTPNAELRRRFKAKVSALLRVEL